MRVRPGSVRKNEFVRCLSTTEPTQAQLSIVLCRKVRLPMPHLVHAKYEKLGEACTTLHK